MVIDDIKRAKEIVRDKNREVSLFSEDSFVFKLTNENINDPNYIRLLSNNDKTLSVIASGDQILNTILFDSYDIDAFDISRFPKYFLELKIAAIKCLSYEEYINFFYDKKAFNRKTFKRVLNYVSGDAKIFWEGLCETKFLTFDFSKCFPRDAYNSTLFSKNAFSKKESELAVELNPYLSEDNYRLLKSKINRIHITYLTGNIMHLDYIKDKTYNLVNLSNICMYQEALFRNRSNELESKFKSFMTNLKLGENGKVINYLFDYYPDSMSYRLVTSRYLDDPNFSIESVKPNDVLLVYRKRS